MSASNTEKQAVNPTAQQQQDFFPPPPPGPPPAQAPHPLQSHPTQPHVQTAQHPNETPIHDYDIPQYDPAHPHYAPPPVAASNNAADDIYDATPTDEHPPQFPPRPSGQQPHDEGASKSSWGHKLAGWGSKAAAPFNALANKMGSETFLPTTMDKECEKAARILKSFCKDGIYSDAAPTTAPAQTTVPANPTGPSVTDSAQPPVTSKPDDAAKAAKKPKVLLTIPSKVIAKAQGLAIFTTVRAGFQVSGSSGSGILIARQPDGSWSPPSGIQVHSVGAGFVIGLDIYDCVVVINSKEALEAFTRTRMSLGSDLAVAAGPWGAGGALDWGVPQNEKGKERAPATLAPPEQQQQQPVVTTGPVVEPTPAVSTPGNAAQGSSKNRNPSPFREAIKKPVYSYVKSRGFYAGVQIDGTVVTERKDANAAFYGQPVSVDKILKGEVPSAGKWQAGAHGLFEVLKGAEGWRGQQGQAGQGAAASAPAPATGFAPPTGVPGISAGLQGMNLGPTGGDGAGTPAAPYSKEAEAAAEVAHGESSSHAAPPPAYTEPTGTNDSAPPAYVDDGQYRPAGGDSKTGLH
ncbi:hypothetical protein B0H66DRAFT_569193 [Apodospora peruviana]|uniref:Ysc84 actin-binding domain-containing protein n=1 Tax=Apodospora peruviana TaxID=516989 RepID=A0AAE0LZ41_9PEZI|nr:hypothetical protein B0H66DRAFT_569193 [Apodospora peruviana]